MKKILTVIMIMAAGIAYGQTYQPVSVDTNTGTIKPDISEWIAPQPTQSLVQVTVSTLLTASGTFTLGGQSVTSWAEVGELLFPTTPSATNETPVYVTGPEFWYAFNEVGGLGGLYFDSAGNQDLTGMPLSTRWPTVTNYAAYISSTNEGYMYVSSASGSTLLESHHPAVTFAYWVLADGLPGTDAMFIAVSTNSNFAANSGITATFTTVGGTNAVRHTLWGRDANGSSGKFWEGTAHSDVLFTNAWNRVVVTYDKKASSGVAAGSYVTTYIDGVQMAQDTAVSNWFVTGDTGSTSTELTALGIGVLPNDGYTGLAISYYLDDVILDDSAWTLVSVTNDYATGRTLAP